MNTGESIRRAYDTVADKYAEAFWNELDKKHFDRVILGWFAGQAPAEDTILELGCGPGEISGFLSGLGAKCLGTDLSPRMIENARKYFPAIPFEVQDFFRLGYPDESFSRVVAYYAIVNLTMAEIESAFKEAHRVLKTGGLFLFTFHIFESGESLEVGDFFGVQGNALTFFYFKVDEMKALVEKLGFTVVDILIRYPYPDAEYQSKRAYFILRSPPHQRPAYSPKQ
jgi:ubiquinone/menaquinone biosynthesis C-methylase UbiE